MNKNRFNSVCYIAKIFNDVLLLIKVFYTFVNSEQATQMRQDVDLKLLEIIKETLRFIPRKYEGNYS